LFPLILKTNKPSPTASTELNCDLISLNPFQSAFSVIEYYRSKVVESSGWLSVNSLIALCDMMTILQIYLYKMKLYYKKGLTN
jgi:hypothetical protein